MSKQPKLAELIYEYVTEHIPSCKFGLQHNGRNDFDLIIWTGKDDNAEGFNLGIITQDTFYVSLPSRKIVWIDVYAPGSIDVIYRLIRQKIAWRLQYERSLDQRYPKTKVRRVNPHSPHLLPLNRILKATHF